MNKSKVSEKFLLASLFALLCILLLPASIARADLGPKPTMHFEFTYSEDLGDLLVVDGQLIECEDAACIQSKPLEKFGPQGFSCFGTTCHATAYGFSDYHMLILSFSDGVTRESNIFTKNAFEANYIVTVEEATLTVIEGRGHLNPNVFLLSFVVLSILLLSGAFLTLIMIIVKGITARSWLVAAGVISGILAVAGIFMHPALPITIAIELLLGFVYIRWKNRELFPTLALLALANVITQFALWAALTTFIEGNSLTLTIILEIIIWLVEGVVFYLPQRKDLTFKEAALLSLLLNLVSFTIGLLLPL